MKNIVLTFLFLTFSFSINSQELDLNYYVPSNQNYNDKIPTPKEIIGHQVGEWHVTHDKLVEYMKVLANSSVPSLESEKHLQQFLLMIGTTNVASRTNFLKQLKFLKSR